MKLIRHILSALGPKAMWRNLAETDAPDLFSHFDDGRYRQTKPVTVGVTILER